MKNLNYYYVKLELRNSCVDKGCLHESSISPRLNIFAKSELEAKRKALKTLPNELIKLVVNSRVKVIEVLDGSVNRQLINLYAGNFKKEG